MSIPERYSPNLLIGKVVVSKEGRTLGEVADIIFETRTGELLHLVLKNPTSYAEALDLERDKQGNLLVPFSAIISVGDFIVVSEEDLV